MKCFTRAVVISPLFLMLTVALSLLAQASPDVTIVELQSISGNVEFSRQPEQWQPLRMNSKLDAGSVIRTRKDSSVDFYLKESVTTLRLTPNSKLAFKSL